MKGDQEHLIAEMRSSVTARVQLLLGVFTFFESWLVGALCAAYQFESDLCQARAPPR